MATPGSFVAGVPLTAAEMNLLPGGLENGGYAQITANQTGITTVTDVTGLTVTWTAVTGRYYRISVQAEVLSTVATDVPTLSITDAANAQKTRMSIALTQAAVSTTLYGAVIETGLSGSITRKVRVVRAIGTGSVTVQAAANQPAFILVEDIGV